MALTPELITQMIAQAKANPVTLPPRGAAPGGGFAASNYQLDPAKAAQYDPSQPRTYTPAQQQNIDLYKAGATKMPDGRPIYGWRETNPPTPILEPFEDPMTAVTGKLDNSADAKKKLDDAMVSGDIKARSLPTIDDTGMPPMPGQSRPDANAADLIAKITGAGSYADPVMRDDPTGTIPGMPKPPNFVNNMEDFFRLSPAERQQAVTDMQQWRPGQMPANNLVDWSGWLNAATSPTQMTAPTDTRLNAAQWDELTRDEQMKLLNPMNVVNSASGLQDGAPGQWGWGGPNQGYNFNVHDYGDMKLKEYGKQTNYADQFGQTVADKFQPGLLASLTEAAQSDPRSKFISDNLTPYMNDPGNLAFSTPNQGRNGPSDPLNSLGAAYDWQQQVADKKAAKKNSVNPRDALKETGMNRYWNGSFAGPTTGNQGLMVNWNLPGSQYPYGPAPVESGGYGGPDTGGSQYDPGPATVGGWGNAPSGGWGTNPYGIPVLGMMPRPQQPRPQRPMPGGYGSAPVPQPPMGGGGGQVGAPPPSAPPPYPGSTSTWPQPRPQMDNSGRPMPAPPMPYNPSMPGGDQGQRPNGMPAPTLAYGGAGYGQGNFRNFRR